MLGKEYWRAGARKHLTSPQRNVGKPDIQRLLALVESQKLREILGNEVFGRSSVHERVYSHCVASGA